MIGAGLDVARLNFSHGTQESQKETYDLLVKLSEEYDHQLSIMCDIQGKIVHLRLVVLLTCMIFERPKD